MTLSQLERARCVAQAAPREAPAVTLHYLNAYLENLDASPALREARALDALWRTCGIRIDPAAQIVGNITHAEACFFHFGSGTRLDTQRLERYILQEGLDAEAAEALRARASQVGRHAYQDVGSPRFDQDLPGFFTPQERRSIASSAATSTWFGGHMVPDYPSILSLGLDGYAQRIEAARRKASPEREEYYQALSTVLAALQELILRHAAVCRGLAAQATEPELAGNMRRAAEALEAVAHRPPQSFREAVQLVILIHLATDCDSFGRFDAYLDPYFRRDWERGVLSREEALGILESAVIKVETFEAIQNMTLGGVFPDGSPCYTPLTELVLEAVRSMGFKGPNLCLRIHPSMPSRYWELVCRSLATGQGLPALYSDTVVIPMLQREGIPLEDARDYCLAGCSQIIVGGKSQFVNDIGMMNFAKILELTLYNGKDPSQDGVQVGPATGEDFPSFEAFLAAFYRQVDYFAALHASINNKDIRLRGAREGYVLRSLFTQGCIESGRGIFQGGAAYNHVQMECIGITNAADSLYAVRQAVFTEKKVSLAQLRQALAQDFAGYDSLRAYLRQRVPKFGNGSGEVDALRREITAYIYRAIRSHPGAMGGHYIPGEVSFVAHEWNGALTGATPDGRGARAVLADSAGSSQGMDRLGPTALMRSVLAIPLDSLVTSVVLNLKFHRDFFLRNLDKAAALLAGFFQAGGQQLQVNVTDDALLRDAMDHPQEHPNLIVRVGGYSDYFVRLNRRLQEEILARSHSVV